MQHVKIKQTNLSKTHNKRLSDQASRQLELTYCNSDYLCQATYDHINYVNLGIDNSQSCQHRQLAVAKHATGKNAVRTQPSDLRGPDNGHQLATY